MRSLDTAPGDFRLQAHRLSDIAADYLESLNNLPAFPPHLSGVDVESRFNTAVPESGIGEEAFAGLADVMRMVRPNSPRFFAYVFGSGLPVGALGEYMASVLNQNVTAWRSSPAAVAIEKTVVRWLAEAIGCKGFSGSLCGGGSAANLMALMMAREAKVPANQSGYEGGVIYCSDEAHMSIPKAAMMLGFGRVGVRRIGVDEKFQLRVDELRAAIEDDLREKRKPVAVVASAGTVSTGSIDPLPAIAELCREHSIWLHVDGAYGALAALAIPEKFDGIHLADSISLDPHKWLYQSAGCGCLLYRDSGAAQRGFAYSEDYARSLSTDPIEGFAFFEESMELSRPFRALKVWLSLRYFGMEAFRQSIREDLRLAQVLAEAIRSEEKLELLAPVPLSAVCFRYAGGSKDPDKENRAILERVIERGKVYISNATIHGKFALRACVVNHRSSREDVLAVVSEVLETAGARPLR
jgi:glutamate/tyrosine decarboxylase-like PLP-dependent enzyme